LQQHRQQQNEHKPQTRSVPVEVVEHPAFDTKAGSGCRWQHQQQQSSRQPSQSHRTRHCCCCERQRTIATSAAILRFGVDVDVTVNVERKCKRFDTTAFGIIVRRKIACANDTAIPGSRSEFGPHGDDAGQHASFGRYCWWWRDDDFDFDSNQQGQEHQRKEKSVFKVVQEKKAQGQKQNQEQQQQQRPTRNNTTKPPKVEEENE